MHVRTVLRQIFGNPQLPASPSRQALETARYIPQYQDGPDQPVVWHNGQVCFAMSADMAVPASGELNQGSIDRFVGVDQAKAARRHLAENVPPDQQQAHVELLMQDVRPGCRAAFHQTVFAQPFPVPKQSVQQATDDALCAALEEPAPEDGITFARRPDAVTEQQETERQRLITDFQRALDYAYGLQDNPDGSACPWLWQQFDSFSRMYLAAGGTHQELQAWQETVVLPAYWRLHHLANPSTPVSAPVNRDTTPGFTYSSTGGSPRHWGSEPI